eukprot:GHRR01001663.1.p1 GENE.GHRR01001663.1~~GHRR01001663.1.p1  ORF type:complete len:251 (+),score=44.78 GHRR01001663.1:93-845(+)
MSYYRRSPERGYRGDDERGFHRERPARRVSVMVRNLPKSISPDDLRYYAEKYGPVKDVYLPKDFYTGEPRGLGFVEFFDERDASDAVRGLDRMMLGGREIQCNFAMQGRKRPDEFRRGGGGGYGRDRGSGYDRSSYGRDRGYDRGGYDRGGYGRDHDRGRDYDRGRDERGRDYSEERGRSRSPRSRSRSPVDRERSPARERSASRSRSPVDRDRSRSRSPAARSRSPSPARSGSPRRRSPDNDRADSPAY